MILFPALVLCWQNPKYSAEPVTNDTSLSHPAVTQATRVGFWVHASRYWAWFIR